MSYANHSILTLDNPVGLDKSIQDLQEELATIDWLDKVYGRAWEFKEVSQTGELFRIPKVYMGSGEYMNVLPNDHFKSMCFFAVRDREYWPDFGKLLRNTKTRQVNIIFWFNLKTIDPAKDYIFTEELKKDVERILKDSVWVESIIEYYDERVENVFDGLINEAKYARYTVNDTEGSVLMYPYSGFRFTVNLSYYEEC